MDDNSTNPKIDRRNFIVGAAGVAAAGAIEITIPGSAFAAGYPQKPLTVVVMYSAGGGTELPRRRRTRAPHRPLHPRDRTG